jgi:hypothetical protein
MGTHLNTADFQVSMVFKPDQLDDIEIVEPPLQELRRKGSFFKRTCLTGCGCLVFFVLIIIIGLRLFIGPGPQNLKTIPEYFPKNIPIYDRDDIERITFISKKYKQRGIQITALFPQVFFASLFPNSTNQNQSTSTTALTTRIYSLKKFWEVFTTPLVDPHDMIQIEWQHISATPEFMITYYKNELIKQNYQIKNEQLQGLVKQFSFDHKNGTNGTLSVESATEKSTTIERAILNVMIAGTAENKITPQSPTSTLENTNSQFHENLENPTNSL